MVMDPYTKGIQMNRTEQTETFMVNSNWKKTVILHGLNKNLIQRCKVNKPMFVFFTG